MSHNICGLIVDGAYDTSLAESLDLRPMLTYGQLTLLPINHYWSAVQAAVRSRPGTLDMPVDGLIPTEAVIVDIVRELTKLEAPRFAIIFTEYFGGMGEQCASAFAGERRLTTGSSINESLRALGVVAAPGLDEFDTVGLAHHRHNPSYLAVYANRADELGV
ncbi:MAG TPA: hypothetical protein VGM39_09045 [Kofleriaceae bacterium]|jgi:hypothetical protein